MPSSRVIRRRRDRGFSLLVVFMLIIVMVGAAATVMLSTQQDLSIAGQDRESLQAFYAAEYAVAQAKDYLTSLSTVFYANNWNGLLTSGIIQLCQPTGVSPPTAPGTAPAANNPWHDDWKIPSGPASASQFIVGGANVEWVWCVHNDAEDISYIDTANFATGGATGDTNDANDNYHQLVIEGYGQVVPSGTTNTLARARVTVYVGPPNGVPAVTANCYSQEGGCGSHTANGGTAEQNIGVISGGGATPVRGL